MDWLDLLAVQGTLKSLLQRHSSKASILRHSAFFFFFLFSSSIPGSGRSPGEGMGYPLQYSWASLVTQTVKNLPAMQETWVWPLGWEDPAEEGMTIPLQYYCLEKSMDRGAWRATVHGVTESRTQLSDKAQHTYMSLIILLSKLIECAISRVNWRWGIDFGWLWYVSVGSPLV